MADRDAVDTGEPVERWVLIGHSPHQHYRIRRDTWDQLTCRSVTAITACGYSYLQGFEVIPDGECALPRCPRCLDELADMAGSTGDRR